MCQVMVIREGMSSVIPVPVVSLYTAKMMEHAVCGLEHVDLSMLKRVIRYYLLVNIFNPRAHSLGGSSCWE